MGRWWKAPSLSAGTMAFQRQCNIYYHRLRSLVKMFSSISGALLSLFAILSFLAFAAIGPPVMQSLGIWLPMVILFSIFQREEENYIVIYGVRAMLKSFMDVVMPAPNLQKLKHLRIPLDTWLLQQMEA